MYLKILNPYSIIDLNSLFLRTTIYLTSYLLLMNKICHPNYEIPLERPSNPMKFAVFLQD